MMKKFCLGCIIIAMILFSIGLAVGNKVDANVIPSNGKAVVRIPAKAIEVAPGVFSLGTAVDNGVKVEGYMIIDYKEGYGKPGTSCGNGVCEPGENANKCPADCSGGEDPTEPDTSGCYTYLAKEAKWKEIEPYMVDAANLDGLDEMFVSQNIAADINKWEGAAGIDILGDEITGLVDGADTVSTDGKNEVMFGDIDSPGAIAVTIIWGVFGGPPFNRRLVEWDMIFDDADFDWGINDPLKMDFENIATHELGHSAGMGDLYTAECAEQTMYGYATEGETKKSTLESGDIAGIIGLYS
ncbi:matrixin family metalloprotease [Candidatus Woesearchaeota archaeon]|nr:matrixin family metalloprotease [Candidatus Woesearchaeota archaeon]